MIIREEKTEFMIFEIYNVPKEINKITYLKFLHRLNLKNYTYTINCLREVTNSLKYYEIIDLIMEFGKNQLSEILLRIINDRKIDIYQFT